MYNWTKEQWAAIGLRGEEIYVTAAAGSGKTTVLVERVISLITDAENPADPERMLVMTFTNAAAAEMSSRIRQRVDALLQENPKDEQLRRQAARVRRMRISTVHAFCNALLKEFWAELDIPPDFQIASDLFREDLREAAVQRTAEELYADETTGFRLFSDLFGRSREDAGAVSALLRLHDFLGDLADPESWKTGCLAALSDKKPLAEQPAGRFLLASAKEAAEAAVRLLQQAMETAAEDEIIYGNYAASLQYDLELAERIAERVDAGDWDGCIGALQGAAKLRAGGKRGADAAVLQRMKVLREGGQKLLYTYLPGRIFTMPESDFQKDAIFIGEMMTILFAAEARFSENLWKQKMRRKMLDYGDLERLAIRLLSDEGEEGYASAELRCRYDHLLVDEYQDTNEVQDRLFTLLASNSFFAVGDVKQSIYRFRRADPEIFLAKRRSAAHYTEGTMPAAVPLTHNFRSAPPAIAAVNHLFERVMTERLGDIDYRAGEQLTTLRTDQPDEPGVTLLLTETETPSTEIEAAAVASKIGEMLKSGYPIAGANGETRSCRPGDFAVLLRAARDKAEVFEEALRAAGIPVSTDAEAGFFENSEIEVLLALLAVIDNPKSDVEMAAAMISPLFGFSPDDLVRLKGTNRRRDLYSAMLRDGGEKERQFLGRLAAWRLAAAAVPVDQLLQDIVDETDAELLLTAGASYARRARNIRLLIDYAARLSRENGLSLAQFLRLAKRKKQQNDGLTGGFSPDADAVNILTIHKAKGLEWPVVFLADTAKGFNLQDSSAPMILFDKSLFAGMRFRHETGGADSPVAIRSTLQFAALSESLRQKSVSEEMRVLYVAMTRAKQRTYVSAAIKDAAALLENTVADEYLLRNAGSMLGWIVAAVADDAPGDLFSVETAAPEELEARAKEVASTPPDPNAAEILRARTSYRYDDEALFAMPSKVSVSALSHGDAPPLSAPSFMSKDGRGAAARGTAIHKFMQYADYGGALASVADEKARLLARGFITESDAELMDTARLEAFFNSDIARRMKGRKLLREYAFIDALPAGRFAEVPAALEDEKVMLQGVVDCIIFEDDGLVIVDYKTDRVENDDVLVARYAEQLRLYKSAVASRFDLPVKECVIYSFALNRAILLEL